MQNCRNTWEKAFLSLLCVNDCNSVQHGTVMIIVAQQHEKTPKSVAWMSPLLGHWVSGPAAPAVGPRIKASFLEFSSWPQCSSDRGGETRSGSSGPHSHTGDRMPCCTILETSPCNEKRKQSTWLRCWLKPSLWEHLKPAHTWGPLWRYGWAWSSPSHRVRGGTVTPAQPPSPLPCVGCRHVRRTRTPAHMSLCTGLYAMICGSAETQRDKLWVQSH